MHSNISINPEGVQSKAEPPEAIAAIVRGLGGGRGSNGQWSCSCPTHADENPSLSVAVGKNGLPVVHCHAGCAAEPIIKYLRDEGLWPESTNGTGPLEAEYLYLDLATGSVLAVKKRFRILDNAGRPVLDEQGKPKKTFAWYQGDGAKGLGGRKERDLPLYRAQTLATTEGPVILVEGEKAADAAAEAGLRVVSPNGGSSQRDFGQALEALAGEDVILWPDNSDDGRRLMHGIASQLAVGPHAAAKVRWFEPSGLPPKGDAYEYFTECEGTADKVLAAPAYVPSPQCDEDLPEMRIYEPTPWPVLAEDALYGLPGEIVRTIEPHTEADPAALLVTILMRFGVTVGDGPHAVAERDKHPARLFPCLVGQTSAGRKGVSHGWIEELFNLAAEWHLDTLTCVSGLSSGEGVVYNVRDKTTKRKAITEKGSHEVSYIDVEDDQGVADKRLLVYEPEFGRTLRVMNREGNPLSAILRQAWDDGSLSVLNKNQPYRATGAHIVVLGHITKEELLRHLDSTEAANGFGNRFLWVAVRRSKVLPKGGNLPDTALAALAEKLAEALTFARSVGRMEQDEGASALWDEVYERLTEGKPGLFGAVTGRGAPQVLRLSLIYALMDKREVVTAAHLRAALAFWAYAEQSARWVFGERLGDSIADTILDELRQRGVRLSQSDIYRNLFQGNVRGDRIQKALNLLLEERQITMTKESTGDHRPTTFFQPAP